MTPPVPSDKNKSGPSPLLFYIILGIIIVAILAFLLLRPRPNNASVSHPSQHQKVAVS